jgi:signal transduction histidine kinase/ActR/RegA family two-component response regulator
VLRATSWLQRAVLVVALLLPPLLAGWFASYQRAQVLDQARRSASRSVVALEQHAANVLDTHSLILRQLDGLTRGKSWEQIGQDAQLKQTISDLVSEFPQLSAIGMADASGRVWLDSSDRQAPAMSVADRDYFIAQKDRRSAGLFVSEASTGRASGRRQFSISIPRSSSSGGFDGAIFTAVPLEHFTSFWQQFAPSGGHLIPLLRSDAALIVRYPVLDSPQRLNPNGPFMRHLRQSPRGLYTAVSEVDGIERTNAYSEIKSYPLYISFSVETRLVLRQWREDVLRVSGLALLGALTLGALWLAVVRQSHQQRVSAVRWRAIAADLEREVGRREQAEEAMRQGRKMEAIGQLAGGIAHDFNNLLAGIMGNLQLLRMRLERGHTQDLARYVEAAETIADKARAMTQRLLAFARRQTLAAAPVDVKERIGSMQDLIARSVGPAIRVATVFASQPCITLCDPNQLDSALLNLAINARDAMPGGGQLTILAERKSVDAAQSAAIGLPAADYVAISMKDTGEGMPPEVIQRAFEPFFTTKPIGQGTGLGLSMVYGFVTQSGGQVKIDSAPGTGTAVTIYLPVHEAGMPPAQAGGVEASSPRPNGRSFILLVDDEESVRAPLAEMLSELGYEVGQAADAAAALQVLDSRQRVDLLVTDVGLPGAMNGRQLADAGRAQRPGLKVMFITGYADRAASFGSLPEGMDIMTKPFGLEDFGRKVSALTETQCNELPGAG